jgi:hypothetical protein
VTGRKLGIGAGAAAISIVAGAGEFLGYALRAVSGYFAERTGKYWPVTFVGYALNLLVVPAMALAFNWPTAAALVMAERVGRAIRKPTVEAMLLHDQKTGQGVGLWRQHRVPERLLVDHGPGRSERKCSHRRYPLPYKRAFRGLP